MKRGLIIMLSILIILLIIGGMYVSKLVSNSEKENKYEGLVREEPTPPEGKLGGPPPGPIGKSPT
jgi:flagellar basal body-associated protein FliL